VVRVATAAQDPRPRLLPQRHDLLGEPLRFLGVQPTQGHTFGGRSARRIRLDAPQPNTGHPPEPLVGPHGLRGWLLAGWERSADFELAMDDWAEFGLSRFSASRGLDTLEKAELVSAVRQSGRPSIVSILDP
jgi:hypothetical protein